MNKHHPNRALSQNELEARRLKAVPYFKQVKSQRWIGNKLGVSREAVGQWQRIWQKEGIAGLRHGQYGRVSKMTAKQERAMQKDILKGAEKAGYSGDFWTLERITNHSKKKTGIAYKERSIWHTLERFGFSCQVPQRRSRERDEQAISTWVKEIWSKVKKGASNTKQSLAFSTNQG